MQLGGHPAHVPDRRDRRRRPRADRPTSPASCPATTPRSAPGCSTTDVLEQLAAASSIPVVNLLSDTGHPCQSLADLLTMRQEWGALDGRTVAWIGDFNNVARSLGPRRRDERHARSASPARAATAPATPTSSACVAAGLDDVPVVTDRPVEAAEGADAVHTDVWASMGQEDEADARHRAFEGFQVDDARDGGGRQPRRLHALPARPTVARRWPPASSTARRARCSPRPTTASTPSAASSASSSRRRRRWSLTKPQRQHRIAKLLAEQAVTSQAHLVELLAAEGVAATQATVSRDLEDLGAIKVRVAGGETVYAIPELPTEQRAPEDHLRRVFGDWVVEVNHSGNLVVLRTPPGSAHVVGSALDRSGLPEVLGTVAGDDTLIVVVIRRRRWGRRRAAALRPRRSVAEPKEEGTPWPSASSSPTAAASTRPSPSAG